MKSNKGITLMSLVAYIVAVMIAVVILSTVLSNYKESVDIANDKTTDVSEYNIFESYFLKEAKKMNNYIEDIDDSFVLFTSGIKYECKDNAVYLIDSSKNKEIMLISNVEWCDFSKDDSKEKTIIKVDLTINDKDYKIETTLEEERMTTYTETIKDDLDPNTSYVGYYADVDGDGTPDGLIFVDLLKGANGNNSTVTGIWNENSNNPYSYETVETSKAYSITTTNYTGENAKFGEHPIISIKKDKNGNFSTGNDRFYVLALKDFTTDDRSSFSWHINWKTEFYRIDSIDSSYLDNSFTTQIPIQTTTGESIGKRNTKGLMKSTILTGNSANLWNHIGTKVEQGWFIPSRAEWCAFLDFAFSKVKREDLLQCTTSNYDSEFGLASGYWTSSQINEGYAFAAYLGIGQCCYDTAQTGCHVRLCTTF